MKPPVQCFPYFLRTVSAYAAHDMVEHDDPGPPTCNDFFRSPADPILTLAVYLPDRLAEELPSTRTLDCMDDRRYILGDPQSGCKTLTPWTLRLKITVPGWPSRLPEGRDEALVHS